LEVLCGDIGEYPGSTETGAAYTFNPACSTSVANIGTTPAQTAQGDLLTAYNYAAGLTGGVTLSGTTAILGNQTLTPGLYKIGTGLEINGPLTLDAPSSSNTVFIFQIGSTLLVDSAVTILYADNATAANVFWQVGSSATLGPSSSIGGTIMALTAITFNGGAVLEGRALAYNAAVVFDGTNAITNP
jgi:type VI secretion system secreted protein VgrG